MSDLRTVLRTAVGDERPSPDALQRVIERSKRRARRRRQRAAGLALTAFAAASLVALRTAFVPDRGLQPGNTSSSTLEPHVGATIPLDASPVSIAVGDTGVWVSAQGRSGTSGGVLYEIDPATNTVLRQIQVEATIDSLTWAGGALWGLSVAKQGATSLATIDPATGSLTVVRSEVFGPLVVAGGSVWGSVSGDRGTSLIRIDPATHAVEAVVDLPGDVWDLTVGPDAIWVLALEGRESDLLRVDLQSNMVTLRVDVPPPGTPSHPVSGEGFVWVPVLNGNDSVVVRIDERTGEIVGDPTPLVGSVPIAVDKGWVWFLDESGELHGLNARTLRFEKSVAYRPHPRLAYNSPSASFDPTTDSVWVVNSENSITRIDLT